MEHLGGGRSHKLGTASGVYIPVCLNIFSILLFLRFGMILGQIGLFGMLGMFTHMACNAGGGRYGSLTHIYKVYWLCPT